MVVHVVSEDARVVTVAVALLLQPVAADDRAVDGVAMVVHRQPSGHQHSVGPVAAAVDWGVYRPAVAGPCYSHSAVAFPSVGPCGVVDPSVDAFPDRYRTPVGASDWVLLRQYSLPPLRRHPCVADVASGS
uniref:Putative secreted protein n=1 Tax=Anopheles triannulatus TaxID=58253 RepID=A0A2M4B2J0_9DIPT